MSEFSDLISEMLAEQASNIHTAILGEIKSIDGNTANVKPIQGDLPLLVALPMVKRRYKVDVAGGGSYGGETAETYGPFYEVGDTVLVVFLERARDGAGDRKHDLSDGVIIGVIA